MNNDDLKLLRQPKESYGTAYETHLFEQYKLYVEMADRISARRMLANSFFLGVHTALISAFSVLIKENFFPSSFIGIVPFIAAIMLCYVWWRIVKSYRQLNSGKFKVVREFEKLLPTAPYDAEWIALGEGKISNLYLPLTHIENWVPLCFGLLYAILSIITYLQPFILYCTN
ncbi:MAG: hypothetical protein JZU70_07990 [Chlorobium sp.]|jgi:hypothetical protein|nr:hypothetical protein [Chlorobium sp.]